MNIKNTNFNGITFETSNRGPRIQPFMLESALRIKGGYGLIHRVENTLFVVVFTAHRFGNSLADNGAYFALVGKIVVQAAISIGACGPLHQG